MTSVSAPTGPAAAGYEPPIEGLPKFLIDCAAVDEGPESPASAPPSHIDHRYSFRLNAIKNYLGVPVAVAGDVDDGGAIRSYLVRMAGEAKLGAAALGLITPDGDLTARGELVVSHAEAVHGSCKAALENLETLQGRPTRFCDVFPEWAGLGQGILLALSPVRRIVSELLAHEGVVSLPDLAARLAERDTEFAREYVFADSEDLPSVEDDHPLSPFSTTETLSDWLYSANTYRGTFVYQLKGLLCHAGFIQSPGSDTSRLTPREQNWRLDYGHLDPLIRDWLQDGSGGEQ